LKCQTCRFVKNKLTNKLCDSCYRRKEDNKKPNQPYNNYNNQPKPLPVEEKDNNDLPKMPSDDSSKQGKNKQKKGECKNCDKKLTSYEVTYCSQCSQDQTEFLNLTTLIQDCYDKDLLELEKNWQVVKNHYLYTNSKRTFEKNKEDNKTRLDKSYTLCRNHLQ
jgi:hypothetical protein